MECSLLRVAGRGCRQQVTFFCFAKRKSPKKRRPAVWVPTLRFGQPAVLEPSGVSLNSLRSDNAIPDPLVSALLGPARTGQSGAGTKDKETNQDKQGIQYLDFFSPLPPLVDAPRSAGSGGSGIALFEPKASLARPRLNRAPQVARSEAEGRSNQGRLFFCLLLVFA